MPRALVKVPSARFAGGLTSQNLGQPDLHSALRQHENYRRALQSLGFDLVVLPSDHHPDSCFVEDMAVTGTSAGGQSLLLATRSPFRDVEQAPILHALRTALPEAQEIAIKEPGCLEGGDILRLGQHWYVGITSRTNLLGFEQFRAAVETVLGDKAFPVEMSDMLHLKTGVSRLDDQTVLALPPVAQTFSALGYRVVVIEPQDWHAANVIAVGRRVLMPSDHPGVSRLLASHGFDPLEVDLSEFKKQDGGASCLSILLP